ncbi:MAG: HIT family protein [Candidatus Zixiibacteriota bacterium]
MKKIFAPWRMKYIKSGELDGDDCFLCRKFEEHESDVENLIIYRGQYCFVLLNLYPYSNGHTMIAPCRHTADYKELSKDELLEINLLSQAVVRAMEEVMNAQGYNIGYNLGRIAGAGCDTHLHMHIVPRWNGDTNFMPVISNTKVISEGLNDTYKSLKPMVEKYAKEILK